MKLTALDVRTREFRSKLRGYDPSAVRAFLDAVGERVEDLTRATMSLREDLADARARVDEFKSREQQVREVLLTARKAADDSLAAAERVAQARITEADVHADTILAEARGHRALLVQEIQQLRRQRDRFRAELSGLLELHREMLEEPFVGADAAEGSPEPDSEVAEIVLGSDEAGDIPVLCELGDRRAERSNNGANGAGHTDPEPAIADSEPVFTDAQPTLTDSQPN